MTQPTRSGEICADEATSDLPIEAQRINLCLPVGSPADVRQLVQDFHASNTYFDNQDLDRLILGVPSTEADAVLWGASYFCSNRKEIEEKYPDEQPWHGTCEIIWTPYQLIRRILHDINLSSEDSIYDLGCGYGRFVIYAGITTTAACRGIEMVDERASVARAAIERLELGNALVTTGKAQDADISDGDVFYMYHPFSSRTFDLVIKQLEAVAEDKPITIISRGAAISAAQSNGKLQKLVKVGHGMGGEYKGVVEFFESPEIAHSSSSRLKPSEYVVDVSSDE